MDAHLASLNEIVERFVRPSNGTWHMAQGHESLFRRTVLDLRNIYDDYLSTGRRDVQELVNAYQQFPDSLTSAETVRDLTQTVRNRLARNPTILRSRESSLRNVPSLVRDMADAPPSPEAAKFDVFISHASEDKEAVARPLAEALKAEGLSVWYDEYTLRIGDSLRRKIDHGLAHSRFGVVVLSQAFFSKNWPAYELDGLVTRTTSGEQIILPVWHNVSKQEVMGYSPSLADRVARNTAVSTVKEIAVEIFDVIQNPTTAR